MSMEPIDWEQAEDSFLAPSLAAGDATGWFDKLCTAGAEGRVTMPWSRTRCSSSGHSEPGRPERAGRLS
jgi:hypothetical protein